MNSLFLFLLFLLLPSCITAQGAESAKCYNDGNNYTAGSTYARNLNNLLTSVVANSGSYNWSSGQGPDRVNAIWRCRGDLSPNDCRECMINATSGILDECPNWKEAYGWYGSCMIRYSNRSIFGITETAPTHYVVNRSIGNVSDPNQFEEALETLLNGLRVTASRSRERFATGSQKQEIYGLLQCTRDLSTDLCDRCLSEVVSQIPTCCAGRVGGGVINPSCNLRFDNYRFYTETEATAPTTSPSPPLPSSQGIGGTKNTSWIIAIVVPVVGVSVLGFLFFLLRYRRKLKRSRNGNQSSSQNDMSKRFGYGRE